MEFKSGIIDTFVGTGELGNKGDGGLWWSGIRSYI